MSSVKKWREFVDGVEVEVLEFEGTVETVEKASMLSGYPPREIVKTLLLRVNSDYIVAIVRGDRRIDYGKASKALSRRIQLAKPSEVKAILGVDVGAVTPFSPRIKQIQVIMDPAIAEQEYIVCGGGAVNKLYRVRVKDLIDYLKPRFLDIFK
jgi:prolyl-tRNA editing enzyme YbaK/EbsC (Cys-tRNA(Pro) deacylase)